MTDLVPCPLCKGADEYALSLRKELEAARIKISEWEERADMAMQSNLRMSMDLAHARADIDRLSVDLAEAQREIQRLREATTILANGSLLPDPGVYDRLDPEMREIICKHLHEYLD